MTGAPITSNLIKVQQNLQNLARTAEAAGGYEINRALKGKLQQVGDTRQPQELQPEWERASVACPLATGDGEAERVGVWTRVSETLRVPSGSRRSFDRRGHTFIFELLHEGVYEGENRGESGEVGGKARCGVPDETPGWLECDHRGRCSNLGNR